jgi:dTDP-D-glucose 4,6-dehydratase
VRGHASSRALSCVAVSLSKENKVLFFYFCLSIVIIKNVNIIVYIFYQVEKILSIQMRYQKIQVRESDQRVFIADIAKVKLLLGWSPQISSEKGITMALDWAVQRSLMTL